LTAATVLERLDRAGVRVTLQPGGGLSIRPVPPPDLLLEARRHRDDIAHLISLRQALDGLHTAARQRPPSWTDPEARPPPGSFCSCCRNQRWWCDDRGWRCWACHPPDHLAPNTFVEVRGQ
jgi:hypothetical protein